MSLYSLNLQILNLLNSDEIDYEALETLFENRVDKFNSIGKMIKGVQSDIESIENEIKELMDKKRRKNNKIEQLKQLIANDFAINEIKKFETPIFKFTKVKNPASVVILDENLIPDDYKKIEQVVKIDKKSIKEDIEDGIKVEGAKIENTESIRIK